MRPAALIQAHLDTLEPAQRELVEALQKLVLGHAPNLTQTLQWGNIVFQRHGRNAIGIAAHRDHVHLQFFNGQALAVQFSALEGHGRGLRFLKLFVPSGIPVYILPLVTFIEVLSFLSRPVSHSVRLFANMLAGHITLKVFGGFVTMLGALGFLGWLGAIVPLGLTVALTALELLVAFLQAYVFAILTCIYLNDAIHPGH